MKDVAERAGVSLGTVSNVLNRPELVKPATRLRVQAAITELGFVRNEPARQLRAGASRVLAYLTPDASNPFFTDIARGVDEVAQAHGLGLFVCSSNLDTRREDYYLQLLQEQRIRGLLLTTVDVEQPKERLAAIASLDIPVVQVDQRPSKRGARCSVGVNDVEGANLAVTHLVESGHERIAFVGGRQTIPQVSDRLRGARVAVEAAGLPPESLVVLEADSLRAEGGRQAAARLLGLPSKRRPTAAFCANDLLALGVLREMTALGIRTPDDLAIVGYDDIDFAEAAAVPLSSVRQPRLELGRVAAQMVIDDAGAGAEHRHEHVEFTPELVVRASSLLHRSAGATRATSQARTPRAAKSTTASGRRRNTA